MAKNPLRRAQLIAPFGCGAMVVVQGGISLITAGLDHWFQREDGQGQIDIDEYVLSEWRLEDLLQVSHFRVPPDFRPISFSSNKINTLLTIPFLRFPQWHFCPKCHLLLEVPLVQRGKVKCPECELNKKTRYMFQVPFVAMCDHGHIQDFPWREWVHQSIHPVCRMPLRLKSTGSASLTGQKVECECGASRTLSQITQASPDGQSTHLSNHLEEGQVYPCQGQRPWLGSGAEQTCGRPLRGSLRNAANVYYAQVRSSIYLPRGATSAEHEIVALIEQPPLSTVLRVAQSFGAMPVQILQALRTQQPLLVQPYSDAQLLAALGIVLQGGQQNKASTNHEEIGGEDRETSFRRAEFDILRVPRNESLLEIRESPIEAYAVDIAQYFARVMLINRLRETRVLAGFSRILPETPQSLDELQAMLWRRPPTVDSWLPAYAVYGEGILLELNEQRLNRWEQLPSVIQRIDRLVKQYHTIQTKRHLRDRPISPRFVLLHTLAHLIMNRLTFECGYSSAALRERLYVSTYASAPMGGILIYTADGDSEGTMGGLVRMGKPGNLEPVIRRALSGAEWCSADPVCMEMGNHGGQGPDSCNLAACHNCSLVPETACEEFNRFLDRAVVVGDIADRSLGYFNPGGN